MSNDSVIVTFRMSPEMHSKFLAACKSGGLKPSVVLRSLAEFYLSDPSILTSDESEGDP